MTELYTNDLKTKHEWAFSNLPFWGNNHPYIFHLPNGEEITHLDIAKTTNPSSVLDYGCGNGLILKDFDNIESYGYDPFVKKYQLYPTVPCDLVLAHHSINHVETQFFDIVLNNLQSLTKQHLVAKIVILPDHPLRTKDWYIEKFEKFFTIQSSFLTNPVNLMGLEGKRLPLSFLTLWCNH